MKFTHSGSALLLAIATFMAVASADAVAGKKLDNGFPSAEEAIAEAAHDYNAAQMDEKSKVVCGLESQVGTRIKRKVCRTVATIEANERNAKYFMRSKKPILENPSFSARND